MNKILLIHQGSELYGSDRSLLRNVSILRTIYSDPTIDIILPEEGPLSKVLIEQYGITVRAESLGVLRKYDLKRLNFSAFYRILKIRSKIKLLNEYDLIFINSMVVLDYIIASRFIDKQVYVHIREIPSGFSLFVFKRLLSFSKTRLLYVSNAAQKAFEPVSNKYQFVLWNACRQILNTVSLDIKNDNVVNLLLIGRINSWKGQLLLLQAMQYLSPIVRNSISVRIVGDVYKQEHIYKIELINFIEKYGLSNIVKILPFEKEADIHYSWSDVVLVPSVLPEPFGLVAIEAMSARKPVIAANHGGLTEIVQHDVTGLLVTPGDARSLASAIERLCSSPSEREAMGAAGKARYEAYFTETKYAENFKEILSNIANKEAL